MEDKIKIIDQIVERHPSYGTEKGWSHYTGGMKDSGDWYFRKMLDVPIEELKFFLKAIELEEAKPTLPPDTSPRIRLMDTTGKYWYITTEQQVENYRLWSTELEYEIWFGKKFDPTSK